VSGTPAELRSLRSYKVRQEIDIDAPCDHVYRIATDPAMIPRFSREIASLELIDPPGSTRRARCRIRVTGVPVPATYRYRYHQGRAYSGIQTGMPVARSFFAFSFRPRRGGVRVSHVEGFCSRVPLLAPLLGILYFHVLSRGGLRAELLRLKHLAESAAPDAAELPAAARPL
jgi:hypothetical protein